MGRRDEIIVGLDIGTTKVSAVVGFVRPEEGRVDVVGVGTAENKGMRKGVVVHLAEVVRAIRRAVEEAELMAGCKIGAVHTGIAGSHVQGFAGHGIVAVADRLVRPLDVARVLDASQAVAMPLDREVIRVIPREYVVDDQAGVRDPVGQHGCRLEAHVHIVTAAATSATDVVTACTQAGLTVLDVALQPLASAASVLTKDERDMGVAVVDLGGGTTDLSVFVDGAIHHTESLGVGGNHLTADIARLLRTPKRAAERLKRKHGCALSTLVTTDEEIEVPSVGGRPPRTLSRQVLAEIIEARMEEILLLVRQKLTDVGVAECLHSGLVLTGGCTQLRGLVELASDIFDLDVRRGTPAGVGSLASMVGSPEYAASVGLVLEAARERLDDDVVPLPSTGEPGLVERLRDRLAGIFDEVF